MFLATIFLFLSVTWQFGPQSVNGQVYFTKGTPHVKLANGGLVSGSVKFSRDGRPYNSFTGIPYAKVPERFAEPEQIVEPSWQGVYKAATPGAMCPQMQFGGGEELFGEEDCLSLNVNVPMNTNMTGNLPVMVWIYGGGFMSGSSEGYYPKYFMDEDVIIVSINYRLGVLGFLSTGDSVVPGNNGLKDMVVALKWVQENIQQFGGDPSLVTIFGESAGGAAVHHLLLSPTTKGLFHRAISQSGSALNHWAYKVNPRRTAVQLATHLKCPTVAAEPSNISSEEILTCFKKLTAKELITGQYSFTTSWPQNLRSFHFGPTLEPSEPVSTLSPFLSVPPISILEQKPSNSEGIPWMVGATEDEGAGLYAGFILSNSDLTQELNSNWDTIAPGLFGVEDQVSKDKHAQLAEKFKEFYFGNQDASEENQQSFMDVCGDELALGGIYKSALAEAKRRKQSSVYFYQYAYKGPISLVSHMFQVKGVFAEKVAHADELLHQFDVSGVFPLPGIADVIKPNTPDEEFSKNFVRLWVSFAIHGEPTHTWGNAELKTWNPISRKEMEGEEPLKWFRIEANPVLNEISQSVKDRMKFWDDLWKEYLRPAIMAKYEFFSRRDAGVLGKTEL